MENDIQNWLKIATYIGSGMCMGFGAIGAAVGEGFTASQANYAISRAPGNAGKIAQTMLVGQAVAESSGIFALVIAMIMLLTPHSAESYLGVLALLSCGMCMGFGALGSGIGSGFPAAAACVGMMRQPAMSNRLMTNMLIGSAITQTPAIFSLVVSLILMYSDFSGLPLSPTWGAILGAGLAAGLAAMGPGMGEGLVAESGCEGVARQPTCVTYVTNTMLLGMAVSETTAIYGLLVSVILLFKTFPASDTIASGAALLAAGICMGFGAIGPGIGEGAAGRNAVRWIARNSNEVGSLTRVMLVGQAVSESTGIYSLVIALILIFVV